MKPRTSWEQIYEDMQREDKRQNAAYKAYSVHHTKPPMSKFWTLVGAIVLLAMSFIGFYLLVRRR